MRNEIVTNHLDEVDVYFFDPDSEETIDVDDLAEFVESSEPGKVAQIIIDSMQTLCTDLKAAIKKELIDCYLAASPDDS